MGFLQRVAKGDASRAVEVTAEDQEWRKTHQALSEYLTSETYSDGGRRQTSTLLIFYEAPEWKACLRDRDTSRSLWMTAGSLPDLIAALDDILREPNPPFRADKPYNAGGGKKR